MQSDQKTLGISFGVLVFLAIAVLLFTAYVVLNIPSMLEGNDPGLQTVSATTSHSRSLQDKQQSLKAAQQLVQYRQRITLLTQKVTSLQKQLGVGRDIPSGETGTPEAPAAIKPSPDPPADSTNPVIQVRQLSEELASMKRQLNTAQDAGEDLLARNADLEVDIETLADDLALLEDLTESTQEAATRQRELFIEAAATTFARMEESPIPYLIECLAEEDIETRIWGANVLGRLGPDAAPALPILRQLLRSGDEALADAAQQAIDDIRDE
jgi:cell division protein FtsB